MSFAKLHPLLQADGLNIFEDPAPMIEFYEIWRKAYERTVLTTERLLISIAAILVRVLHWLVFHVHSVSHSFYFLNCFFTSQ